MSAWKIKSRIRELKKVRKAAERAGAGWEYSEIQREIWGLRQALKYRAVGRK